MDFPRSDIEKVGINKFNELINIKIDHLPFSVASVWLRAGSRFDYPGKEGLAHFFEHLFMIKTGTYPNRLNRLKYLSGLGINFNAYTSHESAYYYHTCLPEHLEQSLDLLIDGLRDSIVTDNDIEKEKNIILDEESRNRNNPLDFLWRLRQKGLWPDDPLGNSLFGNIDSISSITLSDLKKFRNDFYDQSKKVWLIIGNQDLKKSLEQLKLKLGQDELESDKVNSIITITPTTPTKKLIIDTRNISDVAVGVYYRTVSIKQEKDMAIINLLKEYLANNWTSRLIERMRINDNLTYWVNGEIENYSDAGLVGFTFSVNKNRLDDSLMIVQEEIEKVKQNDILGENLSKTKEIYLSNLVQNHLQPENLIWWYGLPASLGGKIHDLATYAKQIQSITTEDLVKSACTYLTEERSSVVLIGDVKYDTKRE